MNVTEEDYPGSIDVPRARINTSALVISDKLRKNDQYPITSKRHIRNLMFNRRKQSCPYMNEWEQLYSKSSLNAENNSFVINAFGELVFHNQYDN
jgi:hypothetical protein